MKTLKTILVVLLVFGLPFAYTFLHDQIIDSWVFESEVRIVIYRLFLTVISVIWVYGSIAYLRSLWDDK